MYTIAELQNGLKTKFIGRELHVYDSIDSTNAQAKRLAASGAAEGTVVISENQTAGRGRMGRKWQSEPGNNLLLSVILRPNLEPAKVGLLPFFAAVCVAETIEKAADIRCECKWPNDILIGGRKCCGILMESTFEHNTIDSIVMGIGLNINQMDFPDDIKDKATSLRRECGNEFDRKEMFQAMMLSIESLYMDARSGIFDAILRKWKLRVTIFNREVSLVQTDEVITGRAVALAEDGGLIVETQAGKKVFYAGNVSISK